METVGPIYGDIAYKTERTLKDWLKKEIGTVKGTTENWLPPCNGSPITCRTQGTQRVMGNQLVLNESVLPTYASTQLLARGDKRDLAHASR